MLRNKVNTKIFSMRKLLALWMAVFLQKKVLEVVGGGGGYGADRFLLIVSILKQKQWKQGLPSQYFNIVNNPCFHSQVLKRAACHPASSWPWVPFLSDSFEPKKTTASIVLKYDTRQTRVIFSLEIRKAVFKGRKGVGLLEKVPVACPTNESTFQIRVLFTHLLIFFLKTLFFLIF